MVNVDWTSRSQEGERYEYGNEEDRLLAVCYQVELSDTLCVHQKKVIGAKLAEEGRIEIGRRMKEMRNVVHVAIFHCPLLPETSILGERQFEDVPFPSSLFK